eukprot:CAMPEP_0197720978 /NCGR_PEP_ID=MMETSP1434-20131217/4182_1 /TAXON_ID=265543 /ORGANISM="Minutocellus polymorphus, Strain CCMP3303" /LENGTH=35 /DNA_ID= /DNA_START= /DNA_END= /DNA_ORIENTATION=
MTRRVRRHNWFRYRRRQAYRRPPPLHRGTLGAQYA